MKIKRKYWRGIAFRLFALAVMPLLIVSGAASGTTPTPTPSNASVNNSIQSFSVYNDNEELAVVNSRGSVNASMTIASNRSFTLSGVTRYLNGGSSNGLDSWISSDSNSNGSIESAGGNTYRTLRAGTAVIQAASPEDNGFIVRITVYISGSSTSSNRITSASLSETSLKVKSGDSATLYLDVSPSDADYSVTWKSENTRIATVSNQSNDRVVVHGRTSGTTTVTADVTDHYNDTNRIYSCTVRVNAEESVYDLTASTTTGTNLELYDLSVEMEDQFRREFDASIASGAEIRLYSFSGASYGTLRASNGSAIQANDDYTWAQFRNMYLVPHAPGVWSAGYELNSGTRSLTGKIEITVRNIGGIAQTGADAYANSNTGGAAALITLNNAAAYSFGSADNTSNTAGASILNTAISAAFGSSGWHHIRFNFGSLSSSSSLTGILYRDSNRGVLTSSENISYSDLSELYFVPSQTGSYEVGFHIYNAAGSITASGTLRIVVPDTLHTIRFSSVHIFQPSDFQYLTNSALAYIIFTPPSGGRLYANYVNGSGTPLPSDARCYFYDSDLGAYPVTSVTYIPAPVPVDTVNAATSEGRELTRSEIISFRLYPRSGASIPGSFRMETGSINASDLFADIPVGTYYDKAVLWAVENGITNGTSPTTFDPYSTCTRGQVATFLWRINGSPEPRTTENPFIDVNPNSAFYKAILWAYENGITTGTSENTFNPAGTCTRAHVITFLWRAANEPAVTHESELAARYAATYYAGAISWADAKGMLQDTATAFSPNALCPRADIITYLYRDLAVLA